jgi:hypothetical protein
MCVACIEEMRNSYKSLVRKPKGKIPLVIHRHRYDNIKVDIKERECESVDCIHLSQNRVQ